jgi:hypothetical protein
VDVGEGLWNEGGTASALSFADLARKRHGPDAVRCEGPELRCGVVNALPLPQVRRWFGAGGAGAGSPHAANSSAQCVELRRMRTSALCGATRAPACAWLCRRTTPPLPHRAQADFRNLSRRVTAARGVVAADSSRCSDIGRDVLRRGGNAVDAAVATTLCQVPRRRAASAAGRVRVRVCVCVCGLSARSSPSGDRWLAAMTALQRACRPHAHTRACSQGVVNPMSSGLGGGAFISIRLANGTAVFIDAREAAPSAASRDMFNGARACVRACVLVCVCVCVWLWRFAHCGSWLPRPPPGTSPPPCGQRHTVQPRP